MERCPNCKSIRLINYPKGTDKDNADEFFECVDCGCEFMPYNEGPEIFKKGKTILL